MMVKIAPKELGFELIPDTSMDDYDDETKELFLQYRSYKGYFLKRI